MKKSKKIRESASKAAAAVAASNAIALGKVSTTTENLLKQSPTGDSPTKDDRPLSSPYISPAYTLSIGSKGTKYTVLEESLYQCSEWASICKSNPEDRTIRLPEFEDDIGHTLVHYLYTSTYQTLKEPRVSSRVERAIEHDRSVFVYCAARKYGLGGLEVLAKNNIEKFDNDISIFDFLDTAQEVYPKLPDDEIWFPKYFENKVKAAFKADETLFKEKAFYDRIGQVAAFDKAVVKSIIGAYDRKTAEIISRTETASAAVTSGKAASEQAQADPYDEITYDAEPFGIASEEIVCEETACEEKACEATACEPYEKPPTNPHFWGLYPTRSHKEPTLEVEPEPVFETEAHYTPTSEPASEPKAEKNGVCMRLLDEETLRDRMKEMSERYTSTAAFSVTKGLTRAEMRSSKGSWRYGRV
ncbi:MAG: hypothetical protein Q9163_003091 [Psora crenata]